MKNIKNESGSILVLVTVSMTLLIGLLGIVVDVVHILIQQTQLVNAVDAMVLAGVQELPNDRSEAMAKAYQYGSANGLEQDELEITVSKQDHRLQAKAERDVNLFFMSLFGINHHQVTANAAAEVGSVSSYIGVVPFGVVWDDFQFGETYYLKFDSHSGNSHSGNFGALSLGASGANTCRNNIKDGYNGLLKVGDQIHTEPGNMAGPTRDGVAHRISLGSEGRIIIVPIIDSLEVSGRDLVTIIGFACFYLEDISGNGNEAEVRGSFVEYVVDGDIGNDTDYGLSSYRLVL